MADQTDTRIDAATLGLLMGDPADSPHGLGIGRRTDPKRVRSVARDTVDRFIHRRGRTAHAYTVAEARAIVATFRERGTATTVADLDALRADLTPASARKTRKRSRKASAPKSGATDAPAPTDAS